MNTTQIQVIENAQMPASFVSTGGAKASLKAAQAAAHKIVREGTRNVIIMHNAANRMYAEAWIVGTVQS
jgi:hypothetical protein